MRCLLLLALVALAVMTVEAEDNHHGKGYFQYTNVKAHKEYEHGYRRGNSHHHRSHFQQNKDHRFRAKVNWADSKQGQGEHYFEYNHGPGDDHKKEEHYKPEPYKPEPYKPEPYAPPPKYN